MSGVAASVVGAVVSTARRQGIDLGPISASIGIDVEVLARSSKRIPWDTIAALFERLEIALGGPDGLRRFAESSVSDGAFGGFRAIGRVLTHPRDLYFLGVRWMGPSLLPMVQAEIWEEEDGTIIERLTLDSEYRECPALFHVFHGLLVALPRASGHGASAVDLTLGPRSATYVVRPSTLHRGRISRLVRAARTRFALPTLLRELERQQQAISESYRELRGAHARISTQANDLARVDSIGRELSRDADLDRVLDALVRIVLDELGFEGVELWLARVEGEPGQQMNPLPAPMQLVRSQGRTSANLSHRHRLESAGRCLAELVVFRAADEPTKTSSGLLDLLLPWIALALDNALTYARLALHAEALEDRVQERTARLADANQRLVVEIDERKRASDALLQSQAQLRASERLASIGTLAAGIAHEINNPIGAILAAAQLAQLVRQDAPESSEVDAALGDIVGEARRCGEIVRSVLRFARDEQNEKWECDANELAQRSVRLTLGFAQQRSTRLVFSGASAPVRILANPTQIEQAIVNLVRNGVESKSREVRVRVVPRPERGIVTLEVEDDGTGIPEGDRLRVLEPFYTTRREDGGTGLGLSVVHGIAQDHKGSLEIDSRPGSGARISLSLPLASAAPVS